MRACMHGENTFFFRADMMIAPALLLFFVCIVDVGTCLRCGEGGGGGTAKNFLFVYR